MKRNLVGKIFGIALVFVMVGSMLGGLPVLPGEAEVCAADVFQISGTIRDNEGNVLSGINVTATDVTTNMSVGSTISDANGYYSIEVPPGTYDLTFTPISPGLQPVVLSNIVVTEASVIDVVLSSPSITFSGKVVDRDGNPVPDIYVGIYDFGSHGLPIVEVKTDNGGFFSLDVLPGSYTLRMRGRSSNPNVPNRVFELYLYYTEPLSLTQNTFMNFTLRNVYLTGKVVDKGGDPVSAVEFSVFGDPDLGAPWSSSYGSFSSTATSDGNGEFRLPLFPGTFRLTATPPAGSGLGEISLEGLEISEDKSLFIILLGTGPDVTPPIVVSTSPEDGATHAPIDTALTATFSEAINSSTINTSTFTLEGNTVSGAVTYDPATFTATFTPDANLEYNHTYTAALSTAITDLAGNPLVAPYSWSFTTQSGAGPKTWYVDDDKLDYPAADFTKIQEAVNNATAGDTIIVYPGTYTENIDVNKDHLTIQSENRADSTIVQAGGAR